MTVSPAARLLPIPPMHLVGYACMATALAGSCFAEVHGLTPGRRRPVLPRPALPLGKLGVDPMKRRLGRRRSRSLLVAALTAGAALVPAALAA